MKSVTMTFQDIASEAGFAPGADGKLNLPPNQDTADRLAKASEACVQRAVGEWQPGDERVMVTLTGAGPVWGYLTIAHALHGRCAALQYAAPNSDPIVVFRHGV